MFRNDRVVPMSPPNDRSESSSNANTPQSIHRSTVNRNGSTRKSLKHSTLSRMNSIRKSFQQVAVMELRMPEKPMQSSVGVYRFLWFLMLCLHVFLIFISSTAVYFFKVLLFDALWLQHLIERTGSRINHSVAYALVVLSCLLILRNFYSIFN